MSRQEDGSAKIQTGSAFRATEPVASTLDARAIAAGIGLFLRRPPRWFTRYPGPALDLLDPDAAAKENPTRWDVPGKKIEVITTQDLIVALQPCWVDPEFGMYFN